MENYFYIISSVIILLALLENLIPNSSSGKSVKTVLSIIAVIVILSPILKIVKGSNNNLTESAATFNEYLEAYQNNLTEKSVELLLKTEGYDLENVKVLGEYNGTNYLVQKIQIKFKNLVINDDTEHIIIIEKIENLISDRPNILKAEIVIEQ